MALLNSPWVLHDVEDTEALLARVIQRSRAAAVLRPDEREDLRCALLEFAFVISVDFDPARGSAFSTHLYSRASRRVIDYVRWERGRTRWTYHDRVIERPPRQLVSLDADESERDRLGETVAGGSTADGELGLPALLRFLEARGRRPGECDELLVSRQIRELQAELERLGT
jgi:hypothetical protein